MPNTQNILDTIVAHKRTEVQRLPAAPVDGPTLQRARQTVGPARDFVGALRKAAPPALALIAEVKKASPSAGVICPDFDPVRIARTYAAAGADCLSVLTDERFFQGSLDYLRQIRAAVPLPLLRKDFIIDERQILEALHAGADAILLIVAILNDAELSLFLDLAAAAELAALVEVHDEEELNRAVRAGAKLIGVNNRNLKTFRVDIAVTARLGQQWRRMGRGAETVLVAESGLHNRFDVEQVAAGGANAILVGEALMRDANIPAKVAELRGRL